MVLLRGRSDSTRAGTVQVALTVSQVTTDVVASCHHYFPGKGGRGIGGAGSPDVFHGGEYI